MAIYWAIVPNKDEYPAFFLRTIMAASYDAACREYLDNMNPNENLSIWECAARHLVLNNYADAIYYFTKAVDKYLGFNN